MTIAADLPLDSIVATNEWHFLAIQAHDGRFWLEKGNPKSLSLKPRPAIVRKTDEQIQALLDDGTGTVHREGPA